MLRDVFVLVAWWPICFRLFSLLQHCNALAMTIHIHANMVQMYAATPPQDSTARKSECLL